MDSSETSLIKEADVEKNIGAMISIEGSKPLTLYSKLHVDALSTMAQLIPPNVEIAIELQRNRDNFALGSPDAAGDYRIKIEEATLYYRVIEFNTPAMTILNDTLSQDAFMRYRRMATSTSYIPSGTLVHKWTDVMNGGALPRRLFVMFVDQRSYAGELNRRPTFCGAAAVRELKVQINGRDELVNPFSPKFEVDSRSGAVLEGSDVKDLLLGLHTITGAFFNSADATPSIGENDLLRGLMIYGVELSNSEATAPSFGCLDIITSFETPGPRQPAVAVLITEADQVLRVVGGKELNYE